MRKNKTTQIMAAIFIVLFTGMFLLLAGRFMYIQATGTVNDVSLKAWAEEKRLSSNELTATRGSIFDRDGVDLAYDLQTYRIYAVLDENQTIHPDDPNHVLDFEKTAEQLAPLLDVESSYIKDRLQHGKDESLSQVEFGNAGKALPIQLKQEIESLDLPGIRFFEESVRYYPNGLFASHVLGFAREDENSDMDDVKGVIGIEAQMDDVLQGENGHISYQQDYFSQKLLQPDEVIKKPTNGHDVYLTIDQRIQVLLEDIMSDVNNDFNPKSMTAVVMNAKTGEILAMSNRPSFDPNEPKDVKNWYNDAISTPFEPGSTMKIFTWAAAIDSGTYNGDELFQSGKYQINPIVDAVHDHNNGKGWGKISFDEGFRRSSNVAASILVWDKMGEDIYYDYLKAFEFDQPTNIQLPGEVSGQILYNWPREKLSTSFGQGSTLTPMQQMKATTAIVNAGEMLQPYIVDKVVDSETKEVIEENKRTVIDQPISAEAAEKTLELLGDVVHSDGGTGKPYRLDSYTIGGKTGTAQMPDPQGGYLKGRENNIFSFLGVAPLEDPELMMFVSVTQPKLANDELGSEPASLIFKNVMENSLHYLNIEPDKDESHIVEKVKIPKFTESPENIKKELEKLGFQVTVVGDGEKIVKANVTEGDEFYLNKRIILITDQPKMPDLTGWSLSDVHQLANLLQLNLETIGHGYVILQGTETNTPIETGDYLGVELQLPNADQSP